MLQRPKKLYQSLAKQKKALPAFSAFNFESTQGIINAASRCRAPVAVQLTAEILKIGGAEAWANLVTALAETSNQPVVLHLEGGDFELIKSCVRAGFTSVKVRWSEDEGGGKLSRVEQVTNYAHERGVWVEGELISLPSLASQIGATSLTDTAAAKRFVRETGVDALAVSVGAIYGAFTGREYINFDLLAEIERELKGVMLTAGGGSGVDDFQIERLAKTRVVKITFGTAVAEAWLEAIRETAPQVKEGREIVKVMRAASTAVRQVAEKKISLAC